MGKPKNTFNHDKRLTKGGKFYSVKSLPLAH